MSIKLMNAAWEADLPATEKLVLLSMADQSGSDGVCWPAVKSIARRCGRDERSVRRTLSKLVEAGHLSRIERPGTSNLWHVHPQGAISDGLHRYIYRVEDAEGNFYIGKRCSPWEPESDKYMGSGSWVHECAQKRVPLRKAILSLHPTDDELAEAEARAIAAYRGDPLCQNRRSERGAGQNDIGFKCHTSPDTSTKGGMTPRPAKPSKNHQRTPTVKEREPAKRWVKRPDDVSEAVWGAFRQHRKSAFTEIALQGFRREAAKAGWTLEAAITEAVERGWQGFKANWVKEKTNGSGYKGSGDPRDGLTRTIDSKLHARNASGAARPADA